MSHLHGKSPNLINNSNLYGNDSFLVLLHFLVAISVFNDSWAVEIYYYHNNWICAYFLVCRHLEHINILCIIIIDVDMNSFKLLMKFIRNINGFIDMNLIWVVGITTINYSMCGRNNRKGKISWLWEFVMKCIIKELGIMKLREWLRHDMNYW